MASEANGGMQDPSGNGQLKAAQLRLALAEAREKAAHLAAGLRELADLVVQGKPSGFEKLASDYASLQDAVAAIWKELGDAAGSGGEGGFEDIEKAIRILEEQEKAAAIQSKREKAGEILQQLDRIRYFSPSGSERIAAVAGEAGKLRALLESCGDGEIPDSLQMLVNGEHPLAALLLLALKGAELADEDFARCLDRIREAFGNSLYAKAAKGAIRIASEELQTESTLAEAIAEPEVKEEEALQPESAHPVPPEASGEVAPGGQVEEQIDASSAAPAVLPPEQTEPIETLTAASDEAAGAGQEDAKLTATEEATTDDAAHLSGGDAQEVSAGETAVAGGKEPALEAKYPEEWLRYSGILHGLIANQKLWQAWALAKFLESQDIGAPLAIPAWVIRAAAAGTQLTGSGDGYAALLQEDLRNFSESVFPHGQRAYNWNIRLLLVAATLRAALVAPQTGAAAVLQALYLGGADGLHEFCQRIAEFGQRYFVADASLLAGLRDLASLQQEKSRLLEEARAWADQAPTFTFKFAPATKVWHRWVEKGRIVWQLTSFARGEAPPDEQEIRKAIERARDEAWFRSEVRRTDRHDNGRKGGRDITADPLEQLRRRLGEAADLAQRWMELQKQEQEWNHAGHFLQEAARLRDELLQLAPIAAQEAARLEADYFQSGGLSGAAVCKTALERFRALLQPGQRSGGDAAEPSDQMLAELLPIPGIEVASIDGIRWTDVDSALRRLESLSAGAAPDLKAVLDEFAAQGDYQRCARILEAAQRAPDTVAPELLTALEEQHEASLRKARLQLREQISRVRRELENAVAHGLLNEKHRTDLNARLEMAEDLWKESLDVRGLLEDVLAVSAEIQQRERQQVAECRRRLEQELAPDHASRAKIVEVLERGDVLTAHEWIDLALKGEDPPPGEPPEDHFIRFFSRLRDLDSRLGRYTQRALIDAVAHRDSRFDRELVRITGAEAGRAAHALQTWHELKRSHNGESEQLREILDFLGFELSDVAPVQGQRDRWYRVKTRPLADRHVCPVPHYGSRAAGRYMLLCAWDRPNEEVLLRDVSEHAQDPVIVCFFGRLTEVRRRNLARLCRERVLTNLVLDDLLMLHLCTVSGLRLPAFFSCALPFTYARAYVTAAGPLPPEMFYGRREALESIMNPQGTCFIYGGRQLGKTALMKEAQRRFHGPDHERHAVWIDLKASGIGYHSQPDEFWPLAAGELKKAGVKADFPTPCNAEGFTSALGSWMESNPQRQLLLLLDEADRFLLEDARPGREGEFVRAAALKGLMDRTGRRFKVVFAGLHDVQRTTTLANHPLAHFGTPLCVGPLLERGEWKEARALIEEPFAKLGYRFEDPGLVTRILSQTNYYPSLIQLYCEQLFDHLMRSPASTHDWNSGPPYVIRSTDVEGAYRSQELRRAIRDRLLWTLQLDKRYEVIAYTLAYEVISADQETRAQLLSNGLDAVHLQRQASSWWPEGFTGARSVDSFRCLLDEMAGLGILRHAGEGRYGLRSPNVLNLLGNDEEIEARLLEPREPELRYEPTQMRTPMGDPLHGRRSPMTWQQESILRGDARVFLIVGTAAGGMEDVSERLEHLFEGQTLVPVAAGSRLRDFRAELQRQSQQGGAIVVVPSGLDWDSQWLKAAGDSLEKQHGDVRAIFLCDPLRLWQVLPLENPVLDLRGCGAAIITLAPWADEALRVWLDDCQVNATQDERRAVAAATGNWPTVLYRFLELARAASSWRDAIGALEQQLSPGTEFGALVIQRLGLDHPEAGRIFRQLIELGEATEQELADTLSEEHGLSRVQKTITWAQMLNLASFGSRNLFQADSLVARLLRGS